MELNIPITALYAGLCGLLSVVLANSVLYVRLRGGSQPDWRPDAMLRVQANFVENVPLALVLLLIAELGGLEAILVHVFGGALVVFRVMHAWGMGTHPGANYRRLIGAQGTFLIISILSAAIVYRFLTY
tara:strand:- start:1657 stop:2043 length:387 start_codon:yes stop_codon:yes gene_type:complete